ncbi:MAG: site-specific integrase, partial [Acidobacteria bacterium]|nr:site-specific integrase [Acidobacteriota bacterium]
RAVFNYAIKHGRARINPVSSVKPLPVPPGREKFLQDDESIARLIGAASDRDREHLRPIIIAALQTGCRKGELFSMRWEDVDLVSEPGIIHIRDSKNNTTHNVYVDSVLRKVLKDQRKWQMRKGIRSEWVFCGPDGKKLKSVKSSWRAACKRAGLVGSDGKPNLHFHDLRHTFASRHVMGGTPLFTVSQLLNHKNPAQVKRYAHLSPAYRQEVAKKNAALAQGWVALLKK